MQSGIFFFCHILEINVITLNLRLKKTSQSLHSVRDKETYKPSLFHSLVLVVYKNTFFYLNDSF